MNTMAEHTLREIAQQLERDEWWWTHSSCENLERAMRLAIEATIDTVPDRASKISTWKERAHTRMAELLKAESKRATEEG